MCDKKDNSFKQLKYFIFDYINQSKIQMFKENRKIRQPVRLAELLIVCHDVSINSPHLLSRGREIDKNTAEYFPRP